MSAPLKVGLLQCDHVADHLRTIAGDYDQMFAALFARHAPQIELQNFGACDGQFPASINDCEAYVATGSRFSAYDDEAWIHQLKDFVRRLHEADRPFVGICFGHQILAEALGGKVEKALQGWGIGVHALHVIKQESWMQPQLSSCGIRYSHRDQVTRMPENATLLGRSDHCPVAMFRVGEKMLGIQGHPEFPAEYTEALVRGRTELIGADKVNATDFTSATDEAVLTHWLARFIGA